MSSCWIVSASLDIWKEEFKGEFNCWEDWKEPISYNFYNSEGKNRRRFTKDIKVGDVALVYAVGTGFIGEGRFTEIIPDDKLVIKPVAIWSRVVSLTEIVNNSKLNEVYTVANHFCASFSKCSMEAYQEALQLKDSNINSYDIKSYVQKLNLSKNIILRGAPGTGKTYLAKQIAASIITDNREIDFDNLTAEQKRQVEFVQFHPSYDYTDFVEGIKPNSNDDGMEFVLCDGVFKLFVDKARANFENSNRSEAEKKLRKKIQRFLSNCSDKEFKIQRGNKFTIIDNDDETITINIPNNEKSTRTLKIEDIIQLLMAPKDKSFKQLKDVRAFFGKNNNRQRYSYYIALYNALSQMKDIEEDYNDLEREDLKKYVFIIDEINRGEISKIFGELFFSIDPGYRGPSGAVSTQYANLRDNLNVKFYIPENVYIIGTMNDIDRSVDSFDFAMRRRFRFIEITPKDREGMLNALEEKTKIDDAIKRMDALNAEITKTEGLNKNYQIGPAYFLKLKDIDANELWTDYLQPLLQDYIQGMYNEDELMKAFEDAYFGENNGSTES